MANRCTDFIWKPSLGSALKIKTWNVETISAEQEVPFDPQPWIIVTLLAILGHFFQSQGHRG